MPTFREDSDGSIPGSNVVFRGRRSSSGTSTLSISQFPNNGVTYIHIDGNPRRISDFGSYRVTISSNQEFQITFDPDENFAGAAGSLVGSFDYSVSPGFIDNVINEPVFIEGVQDNPTSIGIDLDRSPFGLSLPEESLGGFYFDQRIIQTPTDLYERWYVVLTGSDPDIVFRNGHAIQDFLRFTIIRGSEFFEIITVPGDDQSTNLNVFQLLVLRPGVLADFEFSRSVSVTVRVDDNQPGETFGILDQTFTFNVLDRAETIQIGSINSPVFAYDTASDGADTIVGSSRRDIINAGGGNDFVLGLDGDDEIQGGSGNDEIIGGFGNDFVDSGDGNDVIRFEEGGADVGFGGAGDDLIYFGGAFDHFDRVNGGAGTFDRIALQGNYSNLVFDQNSFVGIEVIALLPGSDPRYANLGAALTSYNIVFSDGNVASGRAISIQGNALRVGEILAFNGSQETDGFLRVLGGDSGDTITGGGSNDRLTGRGGADILRGNGGNDIFAFYATSDSVTGSEDRIIDFNIGDIVGLAQIDAISTGGTENDAFSYIGASAFTGTAGQLRAENSSANNWLIQGDVNGDRIADLSIIVSVADGHLLTVNDFVL